MIELSVSSPYTRLILLISVGTFCLFLAADALLHFFRVKCFRRIPRDKQHSLLSCIPSTLHALVVSPLALYTLLTDEEISADPVWGKSVLASVGCSITIGYMIGDFVYMLLKWSSIGSWQFVFHHSITVAAYGYVVCTEKFNYLAMIRLLAEFSTPAVNLRQVLHELNMKDGAAYFYNGLVMVASFMCARILPLPYYVYVIYTTYMDGSLEASGFGKHLVWSSTVILDTLNIMWLHKMIKGALKVFNSRKDSQAGQVKERLKQG